METIISNFKDNDVEDFISPVHNLISENYHDYRIIHERKTCAQFFIIRNNYFKVL